MCVSVQTLCDHLSIERLLTSRYRYIGDCERLFGAGRIVEYDLARDAAGDSEDDVRVCRHRDCVQCCVCVCLRARICAYECLWENVCLLRTCVCVCPYVCVCV